MASRSLEADLESVPWHNGNVVMGPGDVWVWLPQGCTVQSDSGALFHVLVQWSSTEVWLLYEQTAQ
jgi:hypothetical protein